MSENKLYRISREITAPALIAYVEWILENAQRRGLKTLWFLARDGHTLMQIARTLCKARGLDIDCRYLYCSRVALRTPSYHLIGDEAYDLLFLFGFHVTLSSFFERAAVPDDVRNVILQEMNLTQEDLSREIHPFELEDWKRRFRANERFHSHVQSYSRAAYDAAIGYFRQEGLLNQTTVALVDSGWSGSMQRSLRQLLRSAGYEGSIIGYYFGMYLDPKDTADGTYEPFFFTRSRGTVNKLFFNNNLFECMLSANHGMTLGYTLTDGRFGPILDAPPAGPMAEGVQAQYKGVMDGVQDHLQHPVSRRRALMGLRRLTTCPTRAEADAFSVFLFCDDITEKNHYALADAEQMACIPEHALYKRVWRKLTRRPVQKLFVPFWIYGTLAYIPSPVKREWYRLNVWMWDALRYLLHKA